MRYTLGYNIQAKVISWHQVKTAESISLGSFNNMLAGSYIG